MSGRLDPGPLLYLAEDVARQMVKLARHPRGEVAVGWPARAGQIAYNLSPRTTEIAIGAAVRHLLARAGPAPREQGSLLEPVRAGRRTSGGWIARKGVPPAGKISAGLAVATVAGLALLAARRAFGGKPQA